MRTLPWVSDSTVERIEAVVQAIERGVGEKLDSVLLVGPLCQPVRRDSADPELLVIVSELPVALLGNLGAQLVGAPRLPLRVLTRRELLRASDVFALELAEYRARHHLLVGSPPFGDLHFTAHELRLAIERALRELSRSLREQALAALSSEQSRALEGSLSTALDRLVVIAHHTLTLFGDRPPAGEAELLAALGERTQAAAPLSWRAALRMGRGPDRPVEAVGELLELLDGATRLVDAFGAADD